MQIFHRSTNTIAKVSIFGAIFFLAFFGWASRLSCGRRTRRARG